MTADVAISCHDSIGEAPTWDAFNERLLWADHAVGTVHEARLDASGMWRETRRWSLRRPIAAVLPRSKGGIVVATGTDILLWDEECSFKAFAKLNSTQPFLAINDAKCDRRGRLWLGTFTRDFKPAAAALYRVDPDGSVSKVLEGVTLANGLDWSPDTSKFYFVDSLLGCVDSFDFDEQRGAISNRHRIVTFRYGQGIPNGMAVDREGCIWVALTGAGEVHRYTPEGKLLSRVSISTPGATSCAFGGPDGADLCITSRSGRMPDVALTLGLSQAMMDNNSPNAGALFTCRPGVTGAPFHGFAG